MNTLKLFFIVAFGIALNNNVVGMDLSKESLEPTSNHDNRENDSEEHSSNAQEKKEFDDEQSNILLDECHQDDPSCEVIKQSLEQKFDPNVQDRDENRPLHLICDSGNELRIEIIKELISYKADPNVQNVYGETPLHKHYEEDQSLSFTSLFLEYNLDVTIKDNTGYTVLHQICSNSNPSVDVIKKLIASFITKQTLEILTHGASKECVFTYLLCLKAKQLKNAWAKVPKFINFIILVPVAIEKNIRQFLDIKNEDNETALMIARKQEHEDVVVLFVSLENALNKGPEALIQFLDQDK